MVITRMRELALGRPVSTAEGEQIGTVQEVQLDAIQIVTPQQVAYWLPMQSVASVEDGALRLSFAKEALEQYKLERGASGTDGATGAPRASAPDRHEEKDGKRHRT